MTTNTINSRRQAKFDLATYVPRTQKLPKMSHDALLGLIMLFARGYTVRRIARIMLEQYSIVLTDAQVLYGGVLYADDVDSFRRELAETALTTGIARRSERMRRYNELVDQLEPEAMGKENQPPNLKAVGAYLRTMDQAHEEMTESGMPEELTKEDPWANLMKQVRAARPEEAPLQLQQSSTFLTESPAQPLDPDA